AGAEVPPVLPRAGDDHGDVLRAVQVADDLDDPPGLRVVGEQRPAGGGLPHRRIAQRFGGLAGFGGGRPPPGGEPGHGDDRDHEQCDGAFEHAPRRYGAAPYRVVAPEGEPGRAPGEGRRSRRGAPPVRRTPGGVGAAAPMRTTGGPAAGPRRAAAESAPRGSAVPPVRSARGRPARGGAPGLPAGGRGAGKAAAWSPTSPRPPGEVSAGAGGGRWRVVPAVPAARGGRRRAVRRPAAAAA